MRLAYISTDPGIAYGGAKGAAVHLSAITEALAAEGSDVLLLVASADPGAVLPAEVTLEVLPGPGKAASTVARLAFDDELEAWLERRLERFGADVVYERLALHSAAGSAAARRLGIPHLLELNAPLREEASRYRRLEEPDAAKQLERQTLSNADLVLAVSPPLAKYAESRGASRVEILQNAVAVEGFRRPPREGVEPVAVFAGSLRPWHGIETIVETWRLLGCAAPPLTVVGDGPSRRFLDGLGATVTGHVPAARVPELLAGADIGLAPYSAGAPTYFSPLKVFEYLAAGLATIVADLPAVTAVVDPDTAVVIPAGDAEALAESVAALASDSSERKRLGENGRALVEAEHTWSHRARRILGAAVELSETRMARA
jgi:glycosyltransferase involved in cell wall biosynthesis